MSKLIIILGPTASGKTNLSIKLAKKFNGEIISADSRQVYKGMDIGTGKISKKEMKGIPHYLLDVASPKTIFSVGKYQKLANKKIKEIFNKKKVPFLVGGTGFYIQSIIDKIALPQVKPDWKLRKKLEKKTTKQLFLLLIKLDKRRAKSIDKENPRRLIRALEIVIKTKKPVPYFKKGIPDFDFLILGIKKTGKELKTLIQKRLEKRIKQGMIKEVKKLRKSGISFKRLDEFGLEYRFIAKYLKKEIDLQEMKNLLQNEIQNFAKRQMTWFSKDKRIKWIKNQKQAERLVKKFLLR